MLHGPDHNIDDLFYRTVLFPPRPMAKAAVLQDYCNSKLALGTVNDRAAVNPMLTRQQSQFCTAGPPWFIAQIISYYRPQNHVVLSQSLRDFD